MSARIDTSLPEWWSWPIELTTHAIKRMNQRHVCEVDLRTMFHDADSPLHTSTHDPGRYNIRSRLHGKTWDIIVEPDRKVRVLVIITMYPVE